MKKIRFEGREETESAHVGRILVAGSGEDLRLEEAGEAVDVVLLFLVASAEGFSSFTWFLRIQRPVDGEIVVFQACLLVSLHAGHPPPPPPTPPTDSLAALALRERKISVRLEEKTRDPPEEVGWAESRGRPMAQGSVVVIVLLGLDVVSVIRGPVFLF